ncbi:hypothetical protein [Rhodopirellula sallentina]|uniref:Uncharacterized protein n=1 Tax=Rhodopirellula sallentina SM41 TaxID=1263870 RepID=M5UP07_9BACT|nr:hypothetical protein [Rhodopirellula sallentina]EMI57718.1 hypothetical protein RSSM_00827 [Rhodopirellula sallentina SM41]
MITFGVSGMVDGEDCDVAAFTGLETVAAKTTSQPKDAAVRVRWVQAILIE